MYAYKAMCTYICISPGNINIVRNIIQHDIQRVQLQSIESNFLRIELDPISFFLQYRKKNDLTLVDYNWAFCMCIMHEAFR